VEVRDKPIFVMGFVANQISSQLELPAGMRAMLYRNLAKGFRAAAGGASDTRQPIAAGAPD
jgi:hypothetical protein